MSTASKHYVDDWANTVALGILNRDGMTGEEIKAVLTPITDRWIDALDKVHTLSSTLMLSREIAAHNEQLTKALDKAAQDMQWVCARLEYNHLVIDRLSDAIAAASEALKK